MKPWHKIFLTALGGLAAFSAWSQVIQTWTQKSLAGDAITAGESSGVVAMDANYMFVVDNEHETLRLFARYPVDCMDPVYSTNMRPYLDLTSTNPEDDLESCVKAPNTNRIYWLGSHSNSKSSGALRPNRDRLFATTVLGNGTGSPPYSLVYIGRYDHLRADLVTWDANNLHGLGSNYFSLSASTDSGVASENPAGFNIEGLAFAPDGVTAYIGFRTPLVNSSGATTSISQRTNALIVPLRNIADLVTNSPVAGPGQAKFGTPFTLRLGGRGIRSLDSGYPGNYLLTAGPPGDASNPPAAPLDFRLFTWTGNPSDTPIERLTLFPQGYSPEGAVLPAYPILSNIIVQFVSDDSTPCWKSFTTLAGAANQPVLQMLPPFTNHTARCNLWFTPTQTVTVEYSTNLTSWLPLKTVICTNDATPFTDADATNKSRFYRAKF